MQSLVLDSCEHKKVHEIGEDFDQRGRMLKIVRCTTCGLLMRVEEMSFKRYRRRDIAETTGTDRTNSFLHRA
jgi:hypothetical protein